MEPVVAWSSSHSAPSPVPERSARPQPRYLSYYGLCLALERHEMHEALRYCREAVTLESYNPDIRCNLGLVLLRSDRRREAFRCFLRVLNLDPSHAPAQRALRAMGVRRRPAIPFLARTNPINVFFGRIRTVEAVTPRRAGA